jgi:CDP-glycerol glycerophosphotransferase
MKQYIKILFIYILRIVLRLFYILPINERKIIFISWEGKQYACNPKYIFEYMYSLYAGKYIYVWSLSNKEKLPNNFYNVQVCGYLTPGHIYTMMTAKYIITNFTIEPCFPLRKSQIVIYTWHGGGAYKRISDIEIYKKRKWSMSIMRDIRSKMINYVISSCEKFSEMHSDIWNISQNKFLPIGMPRNDILFSHNYSIRDKVHKYHNINNDTKIVLYAPTFRGDFRAPNNADSFYNLDIEKILKSLKNKYGKDFLFLYRAHYRMCVYLKNKPNVISASDYPDMQELLYAADILITDYSSSMWDFSLTFRPCFIFALDLKKYLAEQGFYTPIEEWPFPVAETNEQLIENINNFNEEKYKQAVRKHHVDLGSYENGTACEQFCRFVFSVH